MTINKVALITGGSSGLGLATAQRLLADGMTVIITGRDIDKLQAVARELGSNCYPFPLDMASLSEIPAFVASLHAQFGRIDILVNNAGINLKKPLLEVSDADFQSILQVNTTALFALSREVVRIMLQQDSKGILVNISSMAAQYGIPYVIAYTASKTAVEGMTRALAVELGPQGIRVNAVAPGFIRTPMSSRALDSDAARKAKVLSRTPMGILGEPEDVANAVAFLASDQARFIHGVVLNVDGGNAIGF